MLRSVEHTRNSNAVARLAVWQASGLAGALEIDAHAGDVEKFASGEDALLDAPHLQAAGVFWHCTGFALHP